jgi:hypothetical protein
MVSSMAGTRSEGTEILLITIGAMVLAIAIDPTDVD